MRQRWMVVPGTIRAIAEVDAGVAELVFGSSDAIVLGGWPGATKGQAWASYAQSRDGIDPGGRLSRESRHDRKSPSDG